MSSSNPARGFVNHLTTTAIAQICKEAGWKGARKSALDTFTEIILRCKKFTSLNVSGCSTLAAASLKKTSLCLADIEEIGVRAKEIADLAGRSDVNFLDVKASLENVSVL